MNFDRLSTGWWRTILPTAVLTSLLAGCSMPGKGSSGGPLKGLRSVTTASYQEHPVDDGPPKKVNDPLSLKLRYAQWMEEIENFEAAQENYNIVLKERPEDVDAILGLARIDQVAGRLDAAEAGFKKALGLQPNSVVAKNALGQYYVNRGRLPEALPLLNGAMLGDPTNKVYRFHLAAALARSGDTTAAFPHFVQSVGEPTAHYNVGMILKSQGQPAQAEQHLRQALTMKPDFEAAQQALAEIRQQAQADGTYTVQPQRTPQVRSVGHSRTSAPALAPARPQQQNRPQR
jgi:tetratricopeptide (TPR) repeat protein